MSTNLETSSTSRRPLPRQWVERIFERMSSYYGARFADAWRGIDPDAMKRCWADELSDYTGEEIAQGVHALKNRDWPPTLPEFLRLCRSPLDPKAEWAEACEQMRIRLQGNGEDRWNSVRTYWAAVAIGWYDLNSMGWDAIKTRWINALEKARTDPIPEYLAQLPSPERKSVTRDEAAARLIEIKNKLGVSALPGTTEPGLKWAYRLLEREASGEALVNVARSSYREVLGMDSTADAKEVWNSIKAQRSAA